jgi:hypothetical protein
VVLSSRGIRLSNGPHPLPPLCVMNVCKHDCGHVLNRYAFTVSEM